MSGAAGPPPRRADPHRLLLRALHARAGGYPDAALGESGSTNWSSATFRGARHHLSLELSGPGAAGRAALLADGLDAAGFQLPGHLVADIMVTARRETPYGVTMDMEALTVEDA